MTCVFQSALQSRRTGDSPVSGSQSVCVCVCVYMASNVPGDVPWCRAQNTVHMWLSAPSVTETTFPAKAYTVHRHAQLGACRWLCVRGHDQAPTSRCAQSLEHV